MINTPEPRESTDRRETVSRDNGSTITGRHDEKRLLKLKEQEKQNLSMALFLLFSLCITVIVFALLANVNNDDDEKEKASLQIDNDDVMLKTMDNDTYTLEIEVLITNTAKGTAKNLRVEVIGSDYDSKLTYALGNTTIASLQGEKSQEIGVLITVPRVESHKIQILIFEDDTIKLKGYRVISVEGTGSKSNFKIYYSQESTSVYKSDNDEEGISGFTLMFMFLLLIAVLGEFWVIMSRIRINEMVSGLKKIGENLKK